MISASLRPEPTLTAKKIGLVSQLEILGISSNLLRARCRNMYIMRWSGECAVRDLSLIFREVTRLAEEYGNVVVVSLIDEGAKPPDADGRRVLARHQSQLADRLALANLVDGQGFWASIVLNALLGIQTIKSKRLEREKVFRQREEACEWVKQFVDGGALAHDIDRVLRQCREVAAQSRRLASAS